VNELTLGLLGALLATNQPLAVSNVIQQQTGITVEVAADSVARELRDVMLADDAAQDEVNGWLHDFDALPATNRTAAASAELTRRIRERFDQVRHAYERFLQNHPDSAKGYLAYGSFLNDTGDEEGAKTQYENSRQLDPKNPAVWNDLANYYGEHGPLTNAFKYYAEAIRLKPDEPVYYQNFATTVYLFRKDAREFYRINEQQVFDKALELYRQAMVLAPGNLVLATDYAESYYGIKPMRTNDALVAWTNCLTIARDENEREGVLLHLARVKTYAGMYDEAQAHLDAVTNAAFLDMKNQLERSLAYHKNPPTNAVVETATNSAMAVTNLTAELTNVVIATTNPLPVLTNNISAPANPPVAPKLPELEISPPPLREQKPQ
jgi:tetratricopeptide (TPR) repeat protein